jgi:hypothetical protein
MAVLCVPRAAVQVEHRRERSGAVRLVDAGHQRPAGGIAPELDLAHLDPEPGGRIVRRRGGAGRGVCRMDGPSRRRECAWRQAGQRRHLQEKLAAAGKMRVHGDLLRSTRATHCGSVDQAARHPRTARIIADHERVFKNREGPTR